MIRIVLSNDVVSEALVRHPFVGIKAIQMRERIVLVAAQIIVPYIAPGKLAGLEDLYAVKPVRERAREGPGRPLYLSRRSKSDPC
jgi:hypothetical protein